MSTDGYLDQALKINITSKSQVQGVLSNRQARWLNLACKIAADSNCPKKHGAVLVRGNSLLAVGTNRLRNQAGVDEGYRHISWHAEIVVLRRVTDGNYRYLGSSVSDLSACVLYIARINARGDMRMSRPCDDCFSELYLAGLRKVVYTPGYVERWN